MEQVDCAVIGAGVVGLATAKLLAERGRSVLIIERAGAIGTETSSRNSEVIHAGIYSPPGSLKGLLCRRGRDLLYRYCAERGIAHRACGKIIVGTKPDDREVLAPIAARAVANGVTDLVWVDSAEIAALEPAIDAKIGLVSPSTGIVDSHALMLAYLGDAEAAGATLVLNAPVTGGTVSNDGIVLDVGGVDPVRIACRMVVNAAGFGAPDLARSLAGFPAQHAPTQFLAIGHYYALSGPSPFSRLIYPAPEPGGLGIHVTIDLAGQVKFGPDVRWIDRVDYAFDDSRFDAFVAAIRDYYRALDPARLSPGYTGIRPKLAGPGGPFADFRIAGPKAHGVPGLVNLFGIESPGLTASLAIAERVADLLG